MNFVINTENHHIDGIHVGPSVHGNPKLEAYDNLRTLYYFVSIGTWDTLAHYIRAVTFLHRKVDGWSIFVAMKMATIAWLEIPSEGGWLEDIRSNPDLENARGQVATHITEKVLGSPSRAERYRPYFEDAEDSNGYEYWLLFFDPMSATINFDALEVDIELALASIHELEGNDPNTYYKLLALNALTYLPLPERRWAPAFVLDTTSSCGEDCWADLYEKSGDPDVFASLVRIRFQGWYPERNENYPAHNPLPQPRHVLSGIPTIPCSRR